MLREALLRRARELTAEPSPCRPRQLRDRLLEFVRGETAARRLTLTPEAPTPPDWRMRNLLHLVGVPVLLDRPGTLPARRLAGSALPAALARDRRPGGDAASARWSGSSELAAHEDHDFTNQFSAFGDVKPGLLPPLAGDRAAPDLLDYASRHIFRRGYLTRVQTIHFARWVLLDDGRKAAVRQQL